MVAVVCVAVSEVDIVAGLVGMEAPDAISRIKISTLITLAPTNMQDPLDMEV
jgi:hypothetical protein